MITILPITINEHNLPTIFLDFNPSRNQNNWCISALLKNHLDDEKDDDVIRRRDVVVLYHHDDETLEKDFAFFIKNSLNNYSANVKIESKNENSVLGDLICNPRQGCNFERNFNNDQPFTIITNTTPNNNDDDFCNPLVLRITISARKNHYLYVTDDPSSSSPGSLRFDIETDDNDNVMRCRTHYISRSTYDDENNRLQTHSPLRKFVDKLEEVVEAAEANAAMGGAEVAMEETTITPTTTTTVDSLGDNTNQECERIPCNIYHKDIGKPQQYEIYIYAMTNDKKYDQLPSIIRVDRV